MCLIRYDWWLPQGLAGYVAGLCMSKMFGSTWYQHYIKQVSPHYYCYIPLYTVGENETGNKNDKLTCGHLVYK